MITTILVTALVSVLTTVVLGYFIWSGIAAHKLKKKVVENSEMIVGLVEEIQYIKTNTDSELNKIVLHQDEQNNRLEDLIFGNKKEFHDRIDNISDEQERLLDKRFDNIHKKIENIETMESIEKTIKRK